MKYDQYIHGAKYYRNHSKSTSLSERGAKEMTCKCGHIKSEHASQDTTYNAQECFKCDCLKFEDNSKAKKKLSEACEWDSHEFCEGTSLVSPEKNTCFCSCHSTFVDTMTEEEYQKWRNDNNFPVK